MFARQAIPMTWDYAEANPFASSSGTWTESVDWVAKVLARISSGSAGIASQESALVTAGSAALISTDPPYYDNIGYADLSDYFYVWQRRALAEVHPALFGTVLAPRLMNSSPIRSGRVATWARSRSSRTGSERSSPAPAQRRPRTIQSPSTTRSSSQTPPATARPPLVGRPFSRE